MAPNARLAESPHKDVPSARPSARLLVAKEDVLREEVELTAAALGKAPKRLRKRDVVRQISMRLYARGKNIAEDVLRNVVPERVDQVEDVCLQADSSLEHELPVSRKNPKAREHLWMPKTHDDWDVDHHQPQRGSDDTSQRLTAKVTEHKDIDAFFVSRITDPTSFFYRFHYDDYRHLTPQKAEVQLVDIQWLKAHEEVVSMDRVNGLKKATMSWDAYTEPLLVDIKSGAILDGHHRYAVGMQLRLNQLPAVLVDYLGDDTIEVDVWPRCGRTKLSKQEVIDMALSPMVFPPKTSRHRFTETLPPISIPLSVLRQKPTPVSELTLSIPPPKKKIELEVVEEDRSTIIDGNDQDELSPLQSGSRLRRISINLIGSAQQWAANVTKPLLRSRLRSHEASQSSRTTKLDLIKRPTPTPSDFFMTIRENDPSSGFCKQRAATFEDLLSSDASRREKFFLTRVCDPTSFFYKYRFDEPEKREPKKLAISLVSISWLKAHEHVVSWDRVEGLRRATLRWDAYMEPLLVDSATGAILDGHHRYHVGVQLGLASVPCVLVDYLGDDGITVDVWPNCGRDNLTKQEVIDMALSPDVFPPKTSRHKFSDDLPPISVPLARLRVPMETNVTKL